MSASHQPAPSPSSGTRSEDNLRLIIETGLLLASERSLDVIVQASLDAGMALSGARFGAFFYIHHGDGAEPTQLARVSGFDSAALTLHPGPALAMVDSVVAQGARRFADVTLQPDLPPPPPGYPSVRSCLAVPVRSRSGEVLGALLYGHPDANVFSAESEQLVATIASQASISIDNFRLADILTREIVLADAARALQRQTADRLGQVFDATTDSVLLLDRNWRITFLNRAGVATLAVGRDLVGLDHWVVFPKALGTIFETAYRSVMDGHAPAQFTQQSPTLGLWLEVKVYPTPEGIAVFFHDVSEAHAVEVERAAAARRLRQALDAGQLGTWTWDRDTDLLDLDDRAAQLFGWDAHQPITRTALRERIVLTEDLGLTQQALQQSLQSGGLYSAEYRVDLSGGSPVWVAASGVATFRDGTKQIAGMVGTVQDITARKTQEATLRQSEKLAATGRLAATIAHEINNPLEAVTNLIYLCKTDPAVPEPAQRLLETADNELARVAQIAQQTLGFYRDTTRPVDIDLNEVLSATVDLFARKLRHKRVECRLDLEPNLHIFGLQGEIRQVFSNLLVNAIDASSTGGHILFRAHRHRCSVRQREGVVVLLCDRGSGIPQASRKRLFSPFFTTKQSVGTGLGLWVTRGMVEKHGGTIQVRTRSESPSGTVFRVFLPRGDRLGSPFSPTEN